jgi:hypothetical protein
MPVLDVDATLVTVTAALDFVVPEPVVLVLVPGSPPEPPEPVSSPQLTATAPTTSNAPSE